jgi:hypothetical protein
MRICRDSFTVHAFLHGDTLGVVEKQLLFIREQPTTILQCMPTCTKRTFAQYKTHLCAVGLQDRFTVDAYAHRVTLPCKHFTKTVLQCISSCMDTNMRCRRPIPYVPFSVDANLHGNAHGVANVLPRDHFTKTSLQCMPTSRKTHRSTVPEQFT